MCYKTDKHRVIAARLAEKMVDVPRFIKNYFTQFKSDKSKEIYWGYIENLLIWLYDEKIISDMDCDFIEDRGFLSLQDGDRVRLYNGEKYKDGTVVLESKINPTDFLVKYDDGTSGVERIESLVRLKSKLSSISQEDMKKVTSVDVICYLDSLQKGIGCTTNSLSSLATKKNAYSAFWSYLVRQKIVEDNVVQQIPKHLFKSEVTNYVVKIPTQEQLDNFVTNLEVGNGNEFDCVRNLAIVQLFLGSGIRSEELMGLDVEDLHLDNDAPYVTVLGKGKKEVKDDVLISSKAKCYLEEYLIAREEFLKGRGIENEPALFLSNRNNRMSKTPMTSFFKQYSDGTINPHMLRHWVGTKLYESTHDIVLVQKQLRHKSLETTARCYVHTNDTSLASAVDRLGEIDDEKIKQAS